jgi:hypothetical protein
VSSELLTKLVCRSDPFQRAVEFGRKFEPTKLNVKAGPPW